MPRKAGIDAPGAVHHAIVLGLEGSKVFCDNHDRSNWIDRLEAFLIGAIHRSKIFSDI